MTAINLIPRAHRDQIAVMARTRRWVAAIGVLALCVAGVCAVLRIVGSAQTSRLDGDAGQLAARVEAARQTLDKVRKDVQELSRRLEASETVGVHPDWSTFLAALAQARGDDIVLQGVEVRAEDVPKPAASSHSSAPDAKPPTPGKSGAPVRLTESYRVTIRGFGLSQQGVVAFLGRLDGLGPLVDVRLGQSHTEPFRGVNAVAFDAECRLTERPASDTAVGGVP